MLYFYSITLVTHYFLDCRLCPNPNATHFKITLSYWQSDKTMILIIIKMLNIRSNAQWKYITSDIVDRSNILSWEFYFCSLFLTLHFVESNQVKNSNSSKSRRTVGYCAKKAAIKRKERRNNMFLKEFLRHNFNLNTFLFFPPKCNLGLISYLFLQSDKSNSDYM